MNGAFMVVLLRKILFALCSSLFALAGMAQNEAGQSEWAGLTAAQHRQWERLLHVPRGELASEVTSEGFFLSKQAAFSAERELRATLDAMRQPLQGPLDKHAMCTFPARAYWLSQNGLLSLPQLPHLFCPGLSKWAQVEQVKSTSILLVSGYLGNPASTFGHALIRFNSRQAQTTGGLHDTSVNFGAAVPEGEPILTYIRKGLLGGYEAGFSDAPYFTHDFTYSHKEVRDMWEYELALSTDQQRMLIYHLWEIAGKRFKYYFLTANCASRMTQLLEIVMQEDLLHRGRIWFAPVEMFHRLAQRYGTQWFTSERYIPSSERSLQQEFLMLEAPARIAALRSMASPKDLQSELSPLSQPEQMRVLDALLSHYNHRILAEEPKVQETTQLDRNEVLRARLALPVDERASVTEVPKRLSPASGTGPMRGALGLVHGQGRGTALHLQWSAFSYELTGHNALDASELVVSDLHVLSAAGDTHIDRYDLMRIKKFRTSSIRFPGDPVLSWHLRLGWQRKTVSDGAQLRPSVLGGAGLAHPLGRQGYAYGLLDAVFLDARDASGLEPNVGWVYGWQNVKALARLGKRFTADTPKGETRIAVEATQRIGQHQSLNWTWQKDGKAQGQVGVSLLQYW